MDLKSEIAKALSEGKIILGKKRAMEALKNGNAKTIVYVAGVPEEWKKDIKHYAELNGTETFEFEGTNVSLGVICKRLHGVSVLAIIR